jgi:hypothetical protein
VQQVEQYLSISIYLFKMPYQLLSKNKEQKQKENRIVNPDQLQHLRRDLLRRAKVGLSSQTSRRKDRKIEHRFIKDGKQIEEVRSIKYLGMQLDK